MPAANYRSITIRQDIYDILKYIQENKNKFQGQKVTITELVEMLIRMYSKPYVRAFIDDVVSREEKPGSKLDFETPFHAFVLDEKNIKHYESTSWIRTEDYVKNMSDSMLGKKIRNRILEDDEFKGDKIFILSSDSWNKDEVWSWIEEWARLRYIREKQLDLFVLEEKTADEALGIKDEAHKEKRKYYDMGIYKLSQKLLDPWDTVGYLPIDEYSKPGIYKRIARFEDPKELERAEENFEKLKKKAQRINVEDVKTLQKKPYD